MTAQIVICADGGADQARKLGITPDIILGDFDSISRTTKKLFRRVPQIFLEDQNSTDLEKGLDFCIHRHIAAADIVGATGDRIDHTTGCIGALKKYGKRIEIMAFDAVGTLQPVVHALHLRTSVGEKISLIPVDRCSGITTTNLRYPLEDDRLALGIREGTSNEATAKRVTIRVRRGTLLCYRFHTRPQ